MKLNDTAFQSIYAVAGFAVLVSLSGMLNARAVTGGAVPAGAQIYERQCASCHGPNGEGTKKYTRALAGSRSVGELTRFISKSMPPGPKQCSAVDAEKVASYIYATFYSSLAQARNKPARISLSRLTVRQFRNAVSDLIGSFRTVGKIEVQHGLRAEYFKARRFETNERVIQRIDPEVHFNFGQDGPVPAQFDPHQFSIRWDGGALAPDTGEYEFIVRTEHSVRLWVNDLKRPLIDATVKSGSDTEYHGSAYLLGGHYYPLRLEFSKSNQGVDDTDKQKNRPVAKASISLEWKRPRQAAEVIPQRCLFPGSFPETFAPSAPFPPDDRSIGYERGNSVSKAWDEATTEAALDTAAYVTAHLRELSGAAEGAPDRDARIHAFCQTFVERAFRRPLTPDVEQFYVTRQLKAAPDAILAVKRVVLLALKSPRFLYRELESDHPDAYDTASRLSFALWDSLPDAELLKAAATNQLSTNEQVTHQAERMVADARTWFKLRDFLLQWLKVDQVPDLAKDAKRFPGFDDAVRSDLRTSLELFLENTAWSDRADYRELMLTDKVYLNGRLAKLYGVNLPADAPFQPVSLDPGQRSGVLTQPYMLSSFAYIDTSSPIHRGVLIARNMLGRTLQPPPAAFAPIPADLHPNMTTRQRVALQTKPAACSGCHSLINPLGFTLERFDAIGRLQDKENGQPVDSTGSYESRTGQLVKFSSGRDLGKFLAGSDEAHAAFVEKLFQNLVKQPVRAYGPQALPELERSFAAGDYNIRKLMVEIAARAAIKK